MPTATDTTRADLSDMDATTSLYRAAIGSVGTDYYLPVFARFEAADRSGPSWNWAAALLTLNWMAFRQLWPAAMVYAGVVTGIPLLIFGLGRMLLKWPPEVELGVLLAVLVALIAVPGLYGNALFHAHCRKRMATALAATSTLPEACSMLEGRASSRKRLIWLAMGNVAVTALAVFAYAQATGYNPLPSSSTGARQVAVGRTIELPTEVPAAQPSSETTPDLSAGATPTAPPKTSVLQAVPPTSGTAVSAPLASSGLAATNTLASNRGSRPPDVPASPSTSTDPAKAEPPPTKPVSVPDSQPTAAAKVPATESKAPAPAKPSKEVRNSPTIQASEAAKQAVAAAKEPKKTTAQNPKKASNGEAALVGSRPANAQSQLSKGAATPSKSAEPKYYINVGLFADENNALNAFVKLNDAGFPAFKQTINTSKGKRTRVRVGPFDTDTQAELSADRIKALGLEALVFESPNVIDPTAN